MKSQYTYICVKCNKQFDTNVKDAYYCDICSGKSLDIDKLPNKRFRRSVQSWNEYADSVNSKISSKYKNQVYINR